MRQKNGKTRVTNSIFVCEMLCINEKNIRLINFFRLFQFSDEGKM